MRSLKFRRGWTGVAALVVAASAAPLLNVQSAYAAGNPVGAAAVKTAGGGANLSSGTGATAFTLRLPAVVRNVTGNTNSTNQITGLSGSFANADLGAAITGAGIPANTIVSAVSGTTITISNPATATATGVALTTTQQAGCGGDNGAGYTVASYMVPSSVDPGTLTFDGNGPIPAATGASFRQPLWDTTGTPYVGPSPAAATFTGGPGQIINIPNFDYQVFTAGQIPAGSYNLGIACVVGPASATQMKEYWNAKMSFTANASGGTAQVSWAVLAVPAPPTGVALTAGNGTLSVAFTGGAANPAATGYTATATPTSPAGPAVTATNTVSPISFTGLTNGTTYSVTVHGTNSEGNSVESTPAVTSIVGTLPAAPTGVALTPGDHQLSVAFTPGAANPAATGFTVTATPTSPAGPAVTTTGAGSPIVFGGLTNGTTYSVTVKGTNAVGTGPDSTPGVSGTPVAPANFGVMTQTVTVTVPDGALVFTQVCGKHNAITPAAGDTFAPGASAAPGDGILLGNGSNCALALTSPAYVAGQPYSTATGILNQVQVTDTRQANSGWRVTGLMAPLGVTPPVAGSTISGNMLGWRPQPTALTGQAIASDNADPNTATGLGTSQRLGYVTPGAGSNGLGSAELDARVKLQIPLGTPTGAYSGVLTLTLLSGPA